MAKRTRTTARRRPADERRSQAPRGLVWPVWAAAILAILYLLAHASMVPESLSLWGGLLSALVLGR